MKMKMKMRDWLTVSFMLLCIFFINGAMSDDDDDGDDGDDDDSSSGLLRLRHPVRKADGSLSSLVVGDWGRLGMYNQTLVAQEMGKVGVALDIDYVVSTGDNFYDNGIKNDTDPMFEASFSSIYTQPGLQKKWYNVLGNHDYRGNVSAQLSPFLTKKDWRWFCRRSYILSSSGLVDIFFVDTVPFVEKYFTDPGSSTYDWTNVLPKDRYRSTLLRDLEYAIKNSAAKWKFVVGHHPIKSAGEHGSTQELLDQLLPILLRTKVDLYINGHDHCLQHIGSANETQFLTSGGGSKAWRGGIDPWDPNELKLYYDGQGFMSLQITRSQAKFIFYDVFGKVIHQYTLSK